MKNTLSLHYKFITLLIVTLTTLSFVVNAQHIKYFQRLSADNGLSHNHVMAITQDKEGYMWFATRDGLNQYDGTNITIYESDEEKSGTLSNDWMNALNVDYKDRIWIGTEGKGINWYDKKTKRFYKPGDDGCKGYRGRYVLDIETQNNGKIIWVLTDMGLNRIDATDLTCKNINLNVLGDRITYVLSININKDGDLMVGTRNDGILVLNDGAFNHQITNEKFRWLSVVDLLEDQNGLYWIASKNKGVYTYNKETKEMRTIIHKPQGTYSLLEDKDHNIWIGTDNGGLYIYYPKTKKLVLHKSDSDDPYAIGHPSVFCLFEDNANRVWAGTYNQGASYWDRHAIKFQVHRKKGIKNSLSHNIVSAFAEGNTPNQIWIGTDGGGLNLWNREQNHYTIFDKENTPNFTSNAVISLLKDKKKGLWVGTWGGGLMFKDSVNNFTSYNDFEIKGVRPRHITRIKYDPKGNLWLSTFDRGLCYFNLETKEITSYQTAKTNKMLSTSAVSLGFDTDGSIWVGTLRGACKFEKNQEGEFKLKNVYSPDKRHNESLAHNYVSFPYTDSKNRFWIATQGGGLCLYNRETDSFKYYNKSNGFPSNSIFAIQEDESGLLWLSSSRGILSFNVEKNEITTYDTKDGLQNLVFFKGSVLKLSTGEFLFGGVDGFNLFHPDEIKKNPYYPDTYITNLKIFNKPIDFQKENSVLKAPLKYTERLILDHTQSIFTLNYVGMNLTHPDKNQYAYILEGFEKEWNYVGTQKSATYTNLDAGNYTFKVKSANNDGLWNETPTSIQLTILPPWWETWWFKLLMTLIAIIATTSFYKWRINSLKAQKANLERKVEDRTKELVTKQKEIADQNQHLQQQSEELRQQSEELEAQRDAIESQHKELEVAYQDMSLIGEIGIKTTSSLSIEVILNSVFENLNTMIQAPTFTIGTFHKNEEALYFYEISQGNGEIITRKNSILDNTLETKCFKEKEIIKINDYDKEIWKFKVEETNMIHNSIIIYPLTSKGTAIGTITIQHPKKGHYNQRHLTILQALSVYVSTALDNSEAYSIIENKNHLITESIRYAQKIQESILPTSTYMEDVFGEYFVLFKPKDIVSGDFYWSTTVADKIYIVSADCTGHGVPGAFMSMIGNVLLNKFIKELKLESPADVLYELHRGIQEALHQKTSDNADGMDISICMLRQNASATEVTFAGAKTKIFYHTEGFEEVQVINGDKSTIGGADRRSKTVTFTDKVVTLQKGDMLYLSTDGYIDQNDPLRKRFGIRRFVHTLTEIYTLPLIEQENKLNEILDEHQGEALQRDDITVLGVKIL